MRLLFLGLAAAVMMLAEPSPARAQAVTVDPTAVIVCPAVAGSVAPPDFAAPACETLSAQAIDPQGRMIWVKARLPVPQALLELPVPLGIFVLAKASSEIYLNGERIGRNGLPAATRKEEAVGLMDAVVYAPRELLRAGDNELVLRMSSHHGFLKLAAPSMR